VIITSSLQQIVKLKKLCFDQEGQNATDALHKNNKIHGPSLAALIVKWRTGSSGYSSVSLLATHF
jgi:hypothetical protein